MAGLDSFNASATLTVDGKDYRYFRLDSVPGVERLPYSLKVLAENLLRNEDGENITADHVRSIAAWDPQAQPEDEIQFTPARVVLQDFTGVPCVVSKTEREPSPSSPEWLRRSRRSLPRTRADLDTRTPGCCRSPE